MDSVEESMLFVNYDHVPAAVVEIIMPYNGNDDHPSETVEVNPGSGRDGHIPTGEKDLTPHFGVVYNIPAMKEDLVGNYNHGSGTDDCVKKQVYRRTPRKLGKRPRDFTETLPHVMPPIGNDDYSLAVKGEVKKPIYKKSMKRRRAFTKTPPNIKPIVNNIQTAEEMPLFSNDDHGVSAKENIVNEDSKTSVKKIRKSQRATTKNEVKPLVDDILKAEEMPLSTDDHGLVAKGNATKQVNKRIKPKLGKKHRSFTTIPPDVEPLIDNCDYIPKAEEMPPLCNNDHGLAAKENIVKLDSEKSEHKLRKRKSNTKTLPKVKPPADDIPTAEEIPLVYNDDPRHAENGDVTKELSKKTVQNFRKLHMDFSKTPPDADPLSDNKTEATPLIDDIHATMIHTTEEMTLDNNYYSPKATRDITEQFYNKTVQKLETGQGDHTQTATNELPLDGNVDNVLAEEEHLPTFSKSDHNAFEFVGNMEYDPDIMEDKNNDGYVNRCLYSSERKRMWNIGKLIRDLGTREQGVKFAEDIGLVKAEKLCNTHRVPMIKSTRGNNTVGSFLCRRGKCCNRNVRSRARGTWFEDLKLPLPRMFFLMYCFAHKMPFKMVLLECFDSDDIMLSGKTISTWYKRCRDTVVSYYLKVLEQSGKIGGPTEIVQIVVLKFHKKKNIVANYWIVALMENGSQDLRLELCANEIIGDELLQIVKKHVRAGTTIHTESGSAFDILGENGYIHKKVNDNSQQAIIKTEDVPPQSKRAKHRFVNEDGVHVQGIRSQWSSVKRFLMNRLNENFADKIVEYQWRRQVDRSKRDPFVALLDAVRSMYKV